MAVLVLCQQLGWARRSSVVLLDCRSIRTAVLFWVELDWSWVGFELGWARRSSVVLLELPFYRTAVLVLCRSIELPF